MYFQVPWRIFVLWQHEEFACRSGCIQRSSEVESGTPWRIEERQQRVTSVVNSRKFLFSARPSFLPFLFFSFLFFLLFFGMTASSNYIRHVSGMRKWVKLGWSGPSRIWIFGDDEDFGESMVFDFLWSFCFFFSFFQNLNF